MWSPEKMTKAPLAVAGFRKKITNFKMENSKEQSCSEFHGKQDGRIQNYLWTTNSENRSWYQNETLDYKLKLNATQVIRMQLNVTVIIRNKFPTTWHQEIHNLVQIRYLLKITWMTDFRALVLPPQVTILLASSCHTFTKLQGTLLS